jgi:hypothetical protein
MGLKTETGWMLVIHPVPTPNSSVQLPARFAPGRSAAPTATARTASATTTAAKTITATTAAEATGARFTRTRFVHRQSPATQFSAVEGRHCFIRIAIHRHLDKRKTPGLPCIPVLHNLNSIHLTIGGKGRIQILLCRLERNVPDIYILQGVLLRMLPCGRLFSRELISAG